MNKIKKYSLIIIFCISSIFYLRIIYAQESYQYQISANYFKSEDDDNFKTKLYGISTKLHFSPVKTFDHPLAEAYFLERIGSIELFYGSGEIKAGSFVEGDGPTYGVQIRYMQHDSPIFIQAQFAKSEFELGTPLNDDITVDDYKLLFGAFLQDGFFIGFGYDHTEEDYPGSKYKDDEYSIGTKFVQERANETAFNIEGYLRIDNSDESNDNESNTIIEVLGDYYFNTKVSLGAGLEINAGDDKYDEGKTFTANINAFMNPYFSVNFEFEKFFAENSEGVDDDSIEIIITARF